MRQRVNMKYMKKRKKKERKKIIRRTISYRARARPQNCMEGKARKIDNLYTCAYRVSRISSLHIATKYYCNANVSKTWIDSEKCSFSLSLGLSGVRPFTHTNDVRVHLCERMFAKTVCALFTHIDGVFKFYNCTQNKILTFIWFSSNRRNCDKIVILFFVNYFASQARTSFLNLLFFSSENNAISILHSRFVVRVDGISLLENLHRQKCW